MIKRMPLPIAGLILGLFALGNLLASYSPAIRLCFGAIGAVLYIMYVGRLVVGAGKLMEELKNPVVAGVFATFPMATMLFATYLKPYVGGGLSYVVWIIGVLMHVALILWFSANIAIKKDIKTVFPVWFIMYVGIVVASVSGGAFEAKAIAQNAFWFGLCAYVLLIPIVCYRMFVFKNVPEPAYATNAVFTAPGGLLLAGYMSAFEVKSMPIVLFLTIVPAIFYLYSLSTLPKILKLKFYPSLSAITFPTVITAIGFKMANGYLTKAGMAVVGLPIIVKVMEAVALFCVVYCLVKYVQFLMNPPAPQA